MSLIIQNLSKRFENENPLFEHLSFEVQRGEIVGLFGSSGSGKSTLLHCIAGLEKEDSGEIRFNGKSIVGVEPSKRFIGYMMQDQPLYEHLSVEKNIGFPLRNTKLDKKTRDARVQESLQLLQLKPIANRKAIGLSGGERRRVALGRAVIKKPSVLLLDEPFISLDLALRSSMQTLIATVHQSLQTSTIIVSHNEEWLQPLCDRMISLRDLEF